MADTYPDHYQISSAEAVALGGTEHTESAVSFIVKGTGQNDSPSIEVQGQRFYKLVLDLLDHAAAKCVRSTGGNTHVGVYPCEIPLAGGGSDRFEGVTGHSVGAGVDGTWKVYINRTTTPPTIASAASYPATKDDYIPIAEVVIASSTITSIKDERSLGMLDGFQAAGTVTGTNNATFTIDADNAGAGVDTQISFNRGSTDGDATVRWDETNDRFELESDEDAPTLADLNLLSVLVSGTTMLDTNGAAKVAAAVAGDGLAHSSGVLSVGTDGATTEVSGDQVIVKDNGITTAKLSTALQDKLAQVQIPDASGSSPQTVAIQMLDIAGNNLAEECYVQIGVYDDADANTEATNATIAVGAAGTQLAWSTTDKVGTFKTNSSGLLNIAVTDGTTETIYLVAAPCPRSKILDCSDIGTITIS